MSALRIAAIASHKTDHSIDWDSINGNGGALEIEVTHHDVNRVLANLAPVIAAGVRAGMREVAGQAARETMNALTGRVD